MKYYLTNMCCAADLAICDNGKSRIVESFTVSLGDFGFLHFEPGLGFNEHAHPLVEELPHFNMAACSHNRLVSSRPSSQSLGNPSVFPAHLRRSWCIASIMIVGLLVIKWCIPACFPNADGWKERDRSAPHRIYRARGVRRNFQRGFPTRRRARSVCASNSNFYYQSVYTNIKCAQIIYKHWLI